MTTDRHKARARKQAAKLKEDAKRILGDTCVWCGSKENIQAAHVRTTGLRGASRGSNHRNRDIIAHPDHYLPMCATHHRLFDKLRVCGRQSERYDIDAGEWIPF